ncbi:hypothetical protein CPB84DRAFT_1763906 [Gymnopilus junonius]|uniref:Uncharacterized protein n=1 Tax=Gymnopilus junonius TaxID=109634 RepID=A0A9P5NXY5_GYMJU|nr:hypothetical protein CPB84DRAFT_1763906 [Gymnopilus junonius]
MDINYGRNRKSIADMESELQNLFEQQPECKRNEAGEPVIQAGALVNVFERFSDMYGFTLLSEEESGLFLKFIEANSPLDVTPGLVLGFVAERTKASPSPPSTPPHHTDAYESDEEWNGPRHARTLSNDSDGSTYYQGSQSRPPSRGPPTPGMKSPLDSERRQRSTPLHAPSSWAKRPTPAGRRKSDAGSRSDSESGAPSVWGRSTSGRRRAPSNPTSPSSSSRDLNFSPGSPEYSGPRSRPHSRAQSQPQNQFNSSFDLGYGSPDENNHTVKPRYGFNNYNDSFEDQVSSLPMPRTGDESDEEDFEAGLVPERQKTESTVSIEIHERLELLQKTNEELTRKRMEAEHTLQNKLEEHELELEETHQRLEELRAELSASNREEKELRAKDSRNMTQIAALEAEVAKVQKALEGAKATYSSLQKQYQEQCSVSEKYRDDLRKREETIRSLREAVSLHEIESAKWTKEHENYEERIVQLEMELNLALEAHRHLDEQKQENMLLKETIDRMRFDMDEMRNSMSSSTAGGASGQSSAANTVSKSLGAELAGKMTWDLEEQSERSGYVSEETTVIEEEETEVEGDEEEEDVVQTIITRKKRKVASRAVVQESTRREFDELKEYSDTATQYDPTLFAVNHSMQTESERKPIKVAFSIQTDEIPQPKALPPPPPRITVEMEIQTETEEVAEEPSRSPSPGHDESMASSSSTIVPPTPKQQPLHKHLEFDEPPAYTPEMELEEREWRAAAEALKKWHHGVKIPFEPVAGGISEETAEEWKALKHELGVECTVIDKIVEGSERVQRPRDPTKPRRSGRFYNIYNTYIYGNHKGPSSSSATFPTDLLRQGIVFAGASALVILAITPYISPPTATIPGGLTYYDRAAWNSFNSMPRAGEGFVPDGTAAVWNFLGRVGGGAARLARGWPT